MEYTLNCTIIDFEDNTITTTSTCTLYNTKERINKRADELLQISIEWEKIVDEVTYSGMSVSNRGDCIVVYHSNLTLLDLFNRIGKVL